MESWLGDKLPSDPQPEVMHLVQSQVSQTLTCTQITWLIFLKFSFCFRRSGVGPEICISVSRCCWCCWCGDQTLRGKGIDEDTSTKKSETSHWSSLGKPWRQDPGQVTFQLSGSSRHRHPHLEMPPPSYLPLRMVMAIKTQSVCDSTS